ncbi:MFS general substrate transporter [Aureobasidium pullulans EXF-150]|uniref:MFS general substrate transporter n=1 Tax=Aureobasidium pullulans EXF-150 TaxID=1043002 RepID=A0A074XF36_AURPU|nr:MFS general substrate transporter [Aureobasidium pullulans EXF-150]KEQ80637.1 MFS general substrate transporter [Aureobasidium pullulans EXF-150]
MSISTKLRNFVMGDPSESDGDSDTHVVTNTETPKGDDTGRVYPEGSISDKAAQIDEAQRGVQNIQATTLTWTKTSLASLLILIWILFLTNGFRGSILASLVPYVTSDFQSHSLLTVIEIVAGAMVSAVYIPMAKFLDVWGRAEGFALMVAFTTLGMILMAVSQNLATFCAAQVFYSVGTNGLIYTVCVLAADVTDLRNRGLAFAFTSSPYMITAFAGSKAAEGFLLNVNWRWGFGAFAIIFPCVTAPLFAVLKLNEHKAKKQGLLVRESSGPITIGRVWRGVVDFDLLGVVLFAGGLTVFLLPFNLATSAPNGWSSDYIIAMIVVGLVVLVLFALHEVYLAPAPFLKQEYLMNRTVIFTCLLDATYQMSYYCWNSYFTSFLQVVSNLQVAEAGYVNSTFSVVSGFLLFCVGYLIRRTGHFKWLLFIAVPIYIFALGLMIHFRQPNQYIGYIVMCEIFISIGGSIITLVVQLAVLASVDHQHVAAVLSLLYISGGVGGAIGNTISGTIWTNTFEKGLVRYLPESAQGNLTSIYGNIVTQLAYPINSPERIGIQKAYGYAQTRMLAAGVGLMGLSLIWICFIKNLNVAKMKQTKGVVL